MEARAVVVRCGKVWYEVEVSVGHRLSWMIGLVCLVIRSTG